MWEIIKLLEKFHRTFKNCCKYSLKSRRWCSKPSPGNNQRGRILDCHPYIFRLVHSGFRIHYYITELVQILSLTNFSSKCRIKFEGAGGYSLPPKNMRNIYPELLHPVHCNDKIVISFEIVTSFKILHPHYKNPV